MVISMSAETVYQNPWFSVRKEGLYHYIVEAGSNNGASVLTVVDGTHFLFLQTERRSQGVVLLESPRGYGEEGESSSDAAARELLEETGYRVHPRNLHHLGAMRPNTGILRSRVDMFLAEVSSQDKVCERDAEAKEIVLVPIECLDEVIQEGTMEDSFTLAALFFYTRMMAGKISEKAHADNK